MISELDALQFFRRFLNSCFPVGTAMRRILAVRRFGWSLTELDDDDRQSFEA